jgi:hypothetical protein
VSTIIDTVDAQDTLVGPDLGGWTAGALTVFFANVAKGTIRTDFTDSPQRKAAQHRKKRSGRTDKTAVKTGNHQIQ